MRKTNVEIAKEIASRGYDYAEALRDLDAGRTPEEEQQEITVLHIICQKKQRKRVKNK